MLDQLVGLFGPQFNVEYAALMKTRGGDYDVEDTAHIAIKFQSGVTATVLLSRSGAGNEEKISIIGKDGTLTLDGDLVRLFLRDKVGRLTPHEEYVVKESSSLLIEKGFVSFLDDRTSDKWDIDRDIAVMELIDEIYQVGYQTPEMELAQDPLAKQWSWPRITPDVEDAVDKQLHDTLSIYNNGGIFGQFEKSFKYFHGVPGSYALLHNSGTNALHALYYAAGFGPGDEVIVPVYTFHATVSPLMHLGVKPIFVDTHPRNGNIDPRKVRKAITLKSKAVVVTHMWGIPCAMKEIVDICRETDTLVLEGKRSNPNVSHICPNHCTDCSHAHGASIDGMKVGTFGDGAAWSIQRDKVLSGGEGGISLTVHPEMFYRQLLHGYYNKRCKAEIPKGHPLQDFATTGAGLKNRAHPLAITIAHDQLQKLPAIIDGKSKCAAHFIETLRSVPFLKPPVVGESVQPAWYAMTFQWDSASAPPGVTRDRFVEEVKARGVSNLDIPNSTRPLYDEALYRHPWKILPHVYAQNAFVADWKATDFPGANAFHSSVIKLSVWAYEDDWDTVKACAQIMLEVANDLSKACSN